MTTGTKSIAEIFARARAEERSALIAYIVAGDASLDVTRAVIEQLLSSGVDLIELGVPYSDPLADGPAIIAAGQRALDAGTTLIDVLGLIEETQAPILVFTYANPIMQFGVDKFAARLREVGGLGAIIPDLPLEEAQILSDVFAQHQLDMPLLVAPTTPASRLRRIVEASRGFLYIVTRLGVTGAGVVPNFDAVRERVAQIRATTDLPLAVGFGISTAEHVRAVSSIADGVIIGSALVEAYRDQSPAQAAASVREFLQPLVPAARKS